MTRPNFIAFQVRNRVDFSDNPMFEPSFEFYDQNLLDDIKRGDANTQEFFRLLAVCHTVMPEKNEEGKFLTRQFHRKKIQKKNSEFLEFDYGISFIFCVYFN